ncbi:MAG: hypothetical protein PHX87_02895 [Candidatus Peribacteraceae bacterium]|nr:hypothetical protein [Candidatus Peribacteraceae bacterium]MDD5742356.1 hypothetical protein [Candidatus Peribacteraceae bacterium]
MPVCRQCASAFTVEAEDLAFLEKVSPVFNGKKELIPSPTLCPDCRQQRRLAWRNERKFYQTKCALTGKQMISIYAPENGYTVYGLDAWFSDHWDALHWGRPFDLSQPFFPQFAALMQVTPLLSLLIGECENCDYTNYSYGNKNCYLLSASDFNQDSYFSSYIFKSRNCVDCLFVTDCERCYECIDCEHCTNVLFSQDLKNCADCSFCSSCQGCTDCIGCVNLRNSRNCVLNEQLTPEMYAKRKRELMETLTLSRTRLEKMVHAATAKEPRRAVNLLNCDRSTGNNLFHCEDCYRCFDLIESQDNRYVCQGIKARDCMDVNGVPDSELLYECAATPTVSRSAFCASTWVGSHDLQYCYLCRACQDCFGCVSLHRKRYCILNKQYSKEEYEELVPRVITAMRSAGEWGEFFPLTLSPFAYNETSAVDYFPLDRRDAEHRGWRWKTEETARQTYLGPVIAVPSHIGETDDSITKKILTCTASGQPYRIIPQELKFYREMGIPIPNKCPDQRHKERMALRNPRKLWSRKCQKCGKGIETTYPPERPEIVYCENCYLKEVY